MIDLNKYYISSTFQGASGGSEGRAGYVPQALSGDELKFLRGDGTWQQLQTTAQTLFFTESSAELSISNGNTVSLSGISGSGREDVNTFIIQNSAVLIDTSTIVQTNSTAWFEPERRFDYVTVLDVDYSYSGTALYQTLETSSTWKLIRLTYNNNGTISNQASALDSWTGRLTATYV